MSDVDIQVPRRDTRAKIQLEDQQQTRRADFRDAQWQQVVYPNRKVSNPFYSATIFEITAGIVMLIFGLVFIFRLFFTPIEHQTAADKLGTVFFYIAIAVTGLIGACLFIIRALRYFKESRIYILPNGFPISIDTIMNDYHNLADSVLRQPGYFNVEHQRAGNPIVAPGEINWTYSPQETYAPSNMPREKDDSDESDDSILSKMLQIDEPLFDPLPTLINFFDHIDEREQGNIIAGILEDGTVLQVPIMKMFNHLVGGASGSGKSMYLRSLVYQLITEADESEIPLEIGLADIENNTFPEFRGCRHVRWYAGNYVEIEHMTSELLREVERRKELYESLSSTPKDIERYNTLAGRDGAEELPIVVVFYDEFSALMHRSQAQQKRILSDLLQLALRARKYGIFLVIAGQTFKADLIDTAVLGQFYFNVAFKVRSSPISISILGQPGAEKLKQPGEALVKMKDDTIMHLQAFFLEDDELLDALVGYRDPENKRNIPELVRIIIQYAHEKMDDQVKFREIEMYLREQGIARAEVMQNIEWMDMNKFTTRGPKNSRQLNWARINERQS